jgi:hypothetical protein
VQAGRAAGRRSAARRVAAIRLASPRRAPGKPREPDRRYAASVPFGRVGRIMRRAHFGRSSLAPPSGGSPAAHGREPDAALSGELRDRLAPLPPAPDGGRRRAGARQLARRVKAGLSRWGDEPWLRVWLCNAATLLLSTEPGKVWAGRRRRTSGDPARTWRAGGRPGSRSPPRQFPVHSGAVAGAHRDRRGRPRLERRAALTTRAARAACTPTVALTALGVGRGLWVGRCAPPRRNAHRCRALAAGRPRVCAARSRAAVPAPDRVRVRHRCRVRHIELSYVAAAM